MIIKEVDFILRYGKTIAAIEVKSGRKRDNLPGMETFNKLFQPKRKLLVGGQGLSLKEFLLISPVTWVKE